MTPSVDLGSLARTRPHEYLVRFLFGGIVTAATGIIAHAYGPTIGGLFLAFPAILPASLTLVERHDGRRAATEEARGGSLGATALLLFATVTERLARYGAGVALVGGTCTWVIGILVLWTLGSRASHQTIRRHPRLTLPKEVRSSTYVSVVPPRPADTHRHCVLIVDDQRDTSEGLQLLLELKGYDQVRVAANGAQALALLQADYAPCVILLDMIMPGMDGAHFLAAKAADPVLAGIPVIAVSGSGDTAPPPAGAAVSMLKPIDFDRLLALVAQHCANALGAS